MISASLSLKLLLTDEKIRLVEIYFPPLAKYTRGGYDHATRAVPVYDFANESKLRILSLIFELVLIPFCISHHGRFFPQTLEAIRPLCSW